MREDYASKGKKGCRPTPTRAQRTGDPGRTEKEVVQKPNHSDHIVHVTEKEGEHRGEKVTDSTQDPADKAGKEVDDQKLSGQQLKEKTLGKSLMHADPDCILEGSL